jgi:hypothetical protein
VPRGGCDVYVSEAPRLRSNGLDRVVGVTNRDGIATIEVVSDNPVFVSVSYENVTKTRSFVRGVTPEPFVFTFEYLGGQSDYLNSINWLQDEVRANAAVINSLVEQVNSIAREGDPAKIAELTRRVSQLQNVDEFVQKANSIEAHAKAKNLDISERIKQFREVAEQLRLQTRNLQEKLDGAKMFANAEGQLEDFQNLFNAMKWPESLAALEKFSIDFPDHPHSRKLAGFRTAVQPKDQNHAQARETLLSAIGMTRSQTLMDRWDAMRSALEILLQHNDALYLATINAEWNEWKILFGEEIKEIVALNTSAPPADKPKLIVRSQHAGIVKSDFERLEPLILAAAKESRRVLD